MLLSAVSVLVVAQSSSEIPEGLMNNPVLFRVIIFLPPEQYKINSNSILEPPLMPHRQHRIHSNEYFVYIIREIILVQRQNLKERINK